MLCTINISLVAEYPDHHMRLLCIDLRHQKSSEGLFSNPGVTRDGKEVVVPVSLLLIFHWFLIILTTI